MAKRFRLRALNWKLRTLRARNAARALVTDALLKALDRAERCRRSLLMQEIEEELKATDEAEYCRHIYRRARGHGIDADTVSLLSGERAVATVMFLDLKGSTDYVRSNDPEVVLMTLNQMMADFAAPPSRRSDSASPLSRAVRARSHPRA
jgi:class 3 adenylate cyclase